MKRKWTGIRVLFSICTAVAWWGLLYPELTMTPDTYEIIWEEDVVQAQENMMEWDSEEEIYWRILESENSRIRFKSRLLTKVDELMEQRE